MFEELRKLRDEFHLTDTPIENNSLPLTELLQVNTCQTFLEQVAKMITAPSPMVAASIFSKRYVYSLVVPTLWMMSIYDKALKIEIDNCHIETVYEKGRWLPQLRLEDWSYLTPNGERDRFREQLLTTLMRDHLAPLWSRLNEETKIPKVTLWENTFVYINWFYSEKMKQSYTLEIFQKAQEDYQYLLYGMDAHLFGEKVQPMNRLLRGRGSPDRQRKTCCLSYQVGEGRQFCRTCPHRNKLERQRQPEVAMT